MTARKEPACPCETWTRTVPMLGLHFYILLEKNFFFFPLAWCILLAWATLSQLNWKSSQEGSHPLTVKLRNSVLCKGFQPAAQPACNSCPASALSVPPGSLLEKVSLEMQTQLPLFSASNKTMPSTPTCTHGNPASPCPSHRRKMQEQNMAAPASQRCSTDSKATSFRRPELPLCPKAGLTCNTRPP